MKICNTCNLEYPKVSRCEKCNNITCYGCLFILNKQYLCKGCYVDLLEVKNEEYLYNV